MKLQSKHGIRDGLPIVIGYFPIAMAFGILAKSGGLTIMETLGFSLFVYAGASQFIAVNMIILGAGVGEIVLATLLLNFRHFLMSASLAAKMDNIKGIAKPVLGFGVTDEAFSVASFAEGTLSESYLSTLELFAYSSWVLGTGTGFVIGGILPEVLQRSMDIGLYAMFVAILVPELKKTFKVLTLALLSGAVNSVFLYIFKWPQGWSIVVAIVLVSSLGIFIYGKESSDQEVASHE